MGHQRATGRFEAFDGAVAAGVCRELTEAVVAPVRGSEGARVALERTPAAGVPEGRPPRPEPVESTPGDLPALRGADARHLRDEPVVSVRITGTVVRLRRPQPRGAGIVRLRAPTGAEVHHVRLQPDGQAYEIAGHAHPAGLRVRGRAGWRAGAGSGAPPGSRGWRPCASTRRSATGS
ncbi:hypothetical protein [Streptomyces sp. NPDC014744]|uniref:hypothetical protein n=1 Tax=Streptomyces sp. NPDC014744 TaxID=3364903 RepID=UPI0036F6CF18